MKYVPIAMLAVLILFGCSSVSVQKQDTIVADYSKVRMIGPKKRIFVAEFENRSAYGQRRLGQGISDVLTTELANTNNFILLEREKLETILKEQSLGQSGFINEQSAPQLGKLMGANAIITGSVIQFGTRTETYDVVLSSGKKQITTCAIDIRIVDTGSGQIVWAGSGQGEAVRTYTNVLGSGKAGGYDEALEGDAFRAAVVKVMEKLVTALNNLEWSCTVAKVTDAKMYINAGQKSGLELNTPLVIYTLGEMIVDPSTGKEIGQEETKIGSGTVASYFGEDGAIVNLDADSKVRIGDICKLK